MVVCCFCAGVRSSNFYCFLDLLPLRVLACHRSIEGVLDSPLANRCRLIDSHKDLTVSDPVRRHHQIPAHKRERGCMAGVHHFFFWRQLSGRRFEAAIWARKWRLLIAIRVFGWTSELFAVWAVITARAASASGRHRMLFSLCASLRAIGAIFHTSYFPLSRGSSVAMHVAALICPSVQRSNRWPNARRESTAC